MSKYAVKHCTSAAGQRMAFIVAAATHELVAGPFLERLDAPEGLGGDNVYDDDDDGNVAGFIDDQGRVTV